MSSQPFNIGIIGGGVVGLGTALALAERCAGLRIAVVAEETRVAARQTRHNNGVIHARLYFPPAPGTAVVDVARGAAAMAEMLARRGVEIRTGARVRAIRRAAGVVELEAEGSATACRRFINCAGLYSDVVARLAGVRPEARII